MSPKVRSQLTLSLLALSLAANGVLLWNETAVPQDSNPKPAAGLRPRSAPAPSPTTVAAATQVAHSLDWESLAPADLNGFKAGLLAAGIAPELARVIIQARLAEGVALRRAALAPEATSSDYWKAPEINAQLTVENAAELRKAARSNARLLNELFGPDQAEPSMQDIARRAQYGSIPDDKVEQLQMIDDDYRDLQLIVTAESQLVMLPEDREKVALLQRERLKDIKDLLSPEEFEEYQLRNSQVALGLRSTLDGFEPTESEFRAIFALQQAFADQFPNNSVGDLQAMQANAQQRMQAQQQLPAQIKAALGPERAADYDKGTDFVYRNAQRAAQQLNLPKQAGEQIYNVQKDIQSKAAAIRGNRKLGADERNQQLAALQNEATSRINSTLGGPAGLAAYQKLPASSWITTLTPRGGAPAGVPVR